MIAYTQVAAAAFAAYYRPGRIIRVDSVKDLKPLPLLNVITMPCVSCGAPFDGRWRCSYCTTVRMLERP
jgi:hypothetical protein